MTLRQREPRIHDAAHLAFVRQQPCCVCETSKQIEAAHLRMGCAARGKPPTGMQEKPDDKWSTPLCAYHHRVGIGAQHKMGEQAFWEMVGRDPFQIALRLWVESGGAARAALPRPAARPRRVAARVRTRPKRKIQSNPVIQSRGFPKKQRPMEPRA